MPYLVTVRLRPVRKFVFIIIFTVKAQSIDEAIEIVREAVITRRPNAIIESVTAVLRGE